MTTPELRIAPDGRVAKRSTDRLGNTAWAVIAGPDTSWLNEVRPTDAEVADWLPLVPGSPAPDTEARQQAVDAIERELDLARSGEGYEAAAVAEEIVRRCWPDVAGLRADLDRAHAERDQAQRHARMWKLMAAARAESRDVYVEQLNLAIEGLEEYQRELASVSGARPIPDDAAERTRWPEWAVQRDLQGDRAPTTTSAPTTGPTPAAADGDDLEEALHRVLGAHGIAKRVLTEDDAVDLLMDLKDVARSAASQAPAEPTATPDGVAEIRAAQIAALTSQDTSRVDCSVRAPLTDGQMRRLLLEIRNLKDEGHHAGHTLEMLLDPKLGGLLDDITEFGPLLAAREDTAPPDDYDDDLGGWNHTPSSVPQEGEKP